MWCPRRFVRMTKDPWRPHYCERTRYHGPSVEPNDSACTVAGQMLFNAIQFASYARLRDIATENGEKLTGLRFAAAGAVTGLLVTAVEGPQVSSLRIGCKVVSHQLRFPLSLHPNWASPFCSAPLSLPYVRPLQDLIKSQMQQTMLKSAATGAKPEYSSTLDCVKTVMTCCHRSIPAYLCREHGL
jgi:hypothetical protein